MYCSTCGSFVSDQSPFCPTCGAMQSTGAARGGAMQGMNMACCSNCGQLVQPGLTVCPSCGGPVLGMKRYGNKSKVVAALLCFFFGAFGIHDFYLGYTRNGVAKILLTICTGAGGSLWALVDFIRLLTGSLHTDGNGCELRNN